MRPINRQAYHGFHKGEPDAIGRIKDKIERQQLEKEKAEERRIAKLGPKAGKCRYCGKIRTNVLAHMKAVHPAEVRSDFGFRVERKRRNR
jgi:hypothetical protein